MPNFYPSYYFYGSALGLFFIILGTGSWKRYLSELQDDSSEFQSERAEKIRFFLHLTLFAIWSNWLLDSQNVKSLFSHFDGTILRTMAQNSINDSSFIVSFPMNLYEGMGSNINEPINFNIEPGYLIGSIHSSGTLDTKSAYLVWGLLLFSSTYYLSLSLKLSIEHSILSSWICVLIVLYPTAFRVSEVLTHVPHIATTISFNLVIVSCILRFIQSTNSRQAMIHTSLATISGTYITLTNPLWSVVGAPIVLLMLIQLIPIILKYPLEIRNPRSIMLLVTQIVILILCLQFIVSLYLYNVSYFFGKELDHINLSLDQGSYFFESDMLSKLIFITSIVISTSWLTSKINRKQKAFYVMSLSLTLTYIFAGWISTQIIPSWRGPQISYFEIFLLPFHAINLSITLLFFGKQIRKSILKKHEVE